MKNAQNGGAADGRQAPVNRKRVNLGVPTRQTAARGSKDWLPTQGLGESCVPPGAIACTNGLMSDSHSSPQSPLSTSTSPSHADVTKLWAAFRAGHVVSCPKDGKSMALAVDGGAKTYRLVCTHCGFASPWFGTNANGLVFRSAMPTLGPGNATTRPTTR